MSIVHPYQEMVQEMCFSIRHPYIRKYNAIVRLKKDIKKNKHFQASQYKQNIITAVIVYEISRIHSSCFSEFIN